MGMANTVVLDMPVEFCLEVMIVVCSDLANAKREAFDNLVDKIDGVGVSLFLVDLECPHPGGVIDGRELEATDPLSTLSFERQDLDIHLHMVTKNLLAASLGVNLAQAGTMRKPVDAIALERP